MYTPGIFGALVSASPRGIHGDHRQGRRELSQVAFGIAGTL
jgi:hypothetical protein